MIPLPPGAKSIPSSWWDGESPSGELWCLVKPRGGEELRPLTPLFGGKIRGLRFRTKRPSKPKTASRQDTLPRGWGWGGAGPDRTRRHPASPGPAAGTCGAGNLFRFFSRTSRPRTLRHFGCHAGQTEVSKNPSAPSGPHLTLLAEAGGDAAPPAFPQARGQFPAAPRGTGAGGDPQSPGWGAPGTRAARLGVGVGCQEPHREVVQPPPKSPSSPRGRLSPPAAPGSPATFSNPSPRRAPEQPRPLGSRPPAPEPGFQPAAAPPVSPYLK